MTVEAMKNIHRSYQPDYNLTFKCTSTKPIFSFPYECFRKHESLFIIQRHASRSSKTTKLVKFRTRTISKLARSATCTYSARKFLSSGGTHRERWSRAFESWDSRTTESGIRRSDLVGAVAASRVRGGFDRRRRAPCGSIRCHCAGYYFYSLLSLQVSERKLFL